jgi:membrane protein involved in colicin uptake
MCPVSRNRKNQKKKAKHRNEEIKKQQTTFKNRLMDEFKKKQLAELEAKKKAENEKVEAEEQNLGEFAI